MQVQMYPACSFGFSTDRPLQESAANYLKHQDLALGHVKLERSTTHLQSSASKVFSFKGSFPQAPYHSQVAHKGDCTLQVLIGPLFDPVNSKLPRNVCLKSPPPPPMVVFSNSKFFEAGLAKQGLPSALI